MKKLTLLIALFAAIGHAQAQSTSSANQTSTSQSVAQGSIQFSQNPEHTSETIRNVSGPVLGAYASSFSQMNCSSTAQAGLAVAGFSVAGGASKDSQSCVYEVMAAESVRQSTVTTDTRIAAKLQQAAINARCMISAEATKIMEAAGLTCQTRVEERTDTQPASTRVENGN
jgi:hypothetical protein